MNAITVDRSMTGLRARVRALVEHPYFTNAIIAVIVINAITLGMETSSSLTERYGSLLHAIDQTTLAVFVVELLLRFYAHRLALFRDPWGVFDVVIVGIALMPSNGAFSVLRALRILRALRLVSTVPSMRKVVTALLAALPGMASIIALLLLVLYIAAVMATRLFGEVAPMYFGDLGASLFTLFQVMTVEGWPDIARELMTKTPYAWIFFVIYLLVATFTVLNLFIAVVVNAMQSQVAEDIREGEAEQTEVILAELRALRAEVAALTRQSN
jgi:Ion transport protein.